MAFWYLWIWRTRYRGKLQAIRFARERQIPFFGICLGMQFAVIEYGRNVIGLQGAHSSEFDRDTPHPVICLLDEQREITRMAERCDWVASLQYCKMVAWHASRITVVRSTNVIGIDMSSTTYIASSTKHIRCCSRQPAQMVACRDCRTAESSHVLSRSVPSGIQIETHSAHHCSAVSCKPPSTVTPAATQPAWPKRKRCNRPDKID